MQDIVRHFDKYLPLNVKEREALTSRLTERKIKRKQYILQEGDICKYFTYVVDGCFKMYGVDPSGVITFCIISGNGDAHLKNFSVQYKDGRAAILSSACIALSNTGSKASATTTMDSWNAACATRNSS